MEEVARGSREVEQRGRKRLYHSESRALPAYMQHLNPPSSSLLLPPLTRSLIINGRHSDPAVLCTPTRTYALRQVTQSNSLLLCSLPSPHSSTSTTTPRLTLRSNVTDILELQPVVPRLERIAELLEGSAYAGEDEEERKGRRRLYTVRELRSVVQASDEEMMRGLDEICVLRLDGEYRAPVLQSLSLTPHPHAAQAISASSPPPTS